MVVHMFATTRILIPPEKHRHTGAFQEELSEDKHMKRTFKLEDLDCANCAAKMEDAISKLPGVTKVSINFMAQKMILEADDDKFDAVLKEAVKCVSKVEPDCRIIL